MDRVYVGGNRTDRTGSDTHRTSLGQRIGHLGFIREDGTVSVFIPAAIIGCGQSGQQRTPSGQSADAPADALDHTFRAEPWTARTAMDRPWTSCGHDCGRPGGHP